MADLDDRQTDLTTRFITRLQDRLEKHGVTDLDAPILHEWFTDIMDEIGGDICHDFWVENSAELFEPWFSEFLIRAGFGTKKLEAGEWGPLELNSEEFTKLLGPKTKVRVWDSDLREDPLLIWGQEFGEEIRTIIVLLDKDPPEEDK